MKIILIILGLINAIYLWFVHKSTSLSCVGGSGCSNVLGSEYSTFLGIPLASYGISLYLALLVIFILKSKGELNSHNATSLSLTLITPATAIGIVLFFIQLVYIKAFCLFCFFNSIILIALFIITYKSYLKSKVFNLSISLSQALAIFLILLLPLLLTGLKTKNNKDYIIGEISGEKVTVNQIVDTQFESDWEKVQQKSYSVKKEFFNYKLLQLAAKKEGISIKSYIEKNILPLIKVTDEQARAFYEDKKDEIPNDKTFEELKSSIVKYLKQKDQTFYIRDHIKTLYPLFDASLSITQGIPEKINSNRLKVYSIGNPNAPIKIVEFSDLECGYCKRAFVETKKLINQFKDKIYFEYRHYPLDFHPFSKQFSIASVCAGEQDKFFEFIEIAFANQKEFSKIKPESLAAKIGLNTDEFSTCMKDEFAKNVVDNDIYEGNRLKVNATPTFYINGHYFSGIPTAEDILTFL